MTWEGPTRLTCEFSHEDGGPARGEFVVDQQGETLLDVLGYQRNDDERYRAQYRASGFGRSYRTSSNFRRRQFEMRLKNIRHAKYMQLWEIEERQEDEGLPLIWVDSSLGIC